MGLFDSAASEAADVLGKSSEGAERNSFNRDFGADDFDEFEGTLQPGKDIKIGKFTVPASTEYSWGYGSANNPENQGYLYFDLQVDTTDDGTADTQAEGVVTIAQESPTGRGYDVVASYNISRLTASKSDTTQMVPLPEQVGHDLVTQDSSLTLYVNSDVEGEVIADACDLILPVTEYDLSA